MSVSRKVLIAPSLLAADPLNLLQEVQSVEKAGADWHHIDVMDGHFVPCISMGSTYVRALKKFAKIPIDVHIMVSNPDSVAEDYLNAGADLLTFHVETAKHSLRLVQFIKSKNKMAGIALNPGTPLEFAFELVESVDVIMLMSVNPGFGGQSFIPESTGKIERLAEFLKKKGLSEKVRIEVDGGISLQNSKMVISAGASILVAGSSIYGSKDRLATIAGLREV